MPAAVQPAASFQQAAPRSGFGIFTGWVILIGAVFSIIPDVVRYFVVHHSLPSLLAYSLFAALAFTAGCLVIGGAKHNKFLLGGILALVFGAWHVYNIKTVIGTIRFVIEDPLGTFKDSPTDKLSIIAYGAGDIFGSFLIALGCLLTLFAWIGSGRARK